MGYSKCRRHDVRIGDQIRFAFDINRSFEPGSCDHLSAEVEREVVDLKANRKMIIRFTMELARTISLNVSDTRWMRIEAKSAYTFRVAVNATDQGGFYHLTVQCGNEQVNDTILLYVHGYPVVPDIRLLSRNLEEITLICQSNSTSIPISIETNITYSWEVCVVINDVRSENCSKILDQHLSLSTHEFRRMGISSLSITCWAFGPFGLSEDYSIYFNLTETDPELSFNEAHKEISEKNIIIGIVVTLPLLVIGITLIVATKCYHQKATAQSCKNSTSIEQSSEDAPFRNRISPMPGVYWSINASTLVQRLSVQYIPGLPRRDDTYNQAFENTRKNIQDRTCQHCGGKTMTIMDNVNMATDDDHGNIDKGKPSENDVLPQGRRAFASQDLYNVAADAFPSGKHRSTATCTVHENVSPEYLTTTTLVHDNVPSKYLTTTTLDFDTIPSEYLATTPMDHESSL